MKKLGLMMIAAIACGLGACRSVVLDPARFTGEALRSDTSSAVLTLERTVCFGTCPSYTLAIYESGDVIYNGIQFVETKGIARGTIARSDLRALLEEARRIDIMAMENSYLSQTFIDSTRGRRDTLHIMTSDLPTCYISVRLDGRRKSIEDYEGAPGALGRFENLVDSLAGTARWIGR